MQNTMLHLEKTGSYCGADVFHILGLTDAEIRRILNAPEEGKDTRAVLANTLDVSGNNYRPGRLGPCWRWGNGIYSISRWRGGLLVEVGASCD